ncbi:MAG: transglycosylase SLT domain-containing protein [Candidatus Eisenbacteria bacterium]|nr:transglycosylase SLT domain-containing protein [Candidatus Eisenbacteria bacterium]
MRRLMRLLVLLMLVGVVAGCSTTQPPSGDPVSRSPVTGAPADSLARAEHLYRDALGHYVLDEWDQASVLLRRAERAVSGAASGSRAERSDAASLTKRIDYFLEIIGTRDAPVEVVEAPARVDTTVVDAADAEVPEPPLRPVIEPVVNARVEKWLDYFQGRGRSQMSRWLSRSSKYRPMIEQMLEEHGLPSELFFLAMIESGFNPKAYSRAHASGMWQFISSRARMHGLRVDWWVDERRDPEKATRAACEYLRDLYGMFGSWELALAGYNSGEGRVARARRRRPGCHDFWCLDLPRETENFVPKFMAALIIGSDPEKHGFTGCTPEPPLEYDTILVDGAFDLDVIARVAGVSVDAVRELNPALRRWCTAPSSGPTTLRVPVGTGDRTLAGLHAIPREERVSWQRHRIARGETLWDIARAYGTSVHAIASTNSISNPSRIRAGDFLVIPVGAVESGDGGYIEYVVQRGDTISSIARRHGRSTRQVLRTNGLSWHSRIYPGDRIRIPM